MSTNSEKVARYIWQLEYAKRAYILEDVETVGDYMRPKKMSQVMAEQVVAGFKAKHPDKALKITYDGCFPVIIVKELLVPVSMLKKAWMANRYVAGEHYDSFEHFCKQNNIPWRDSFTP